MGNCLDSPFGMLPAVSGRISRSFVSTGIKASRKTAVSAFCIRKFASYIPPAVQRAAMADLAPPMANPNKRPHQNGDGQFNKKRKVHKEKRQKKKPVGAGESHEEILLADIRAFKEANGIETNSDQATLPERFSTVKVNISYLSSTGDGLGTTEANDRVYVVPFTVLGDEVEVKVVAHLKDHTITDFLSVVKPGPQRDDSRIGCGYFAKCGGCQFQMMSYEDQLEHKRQVIERAFRNFSDLPPEVLPPVGPTMPSPLQYNYRTKLTPHFDGPRKGGFTKDTPIPPIGFMLKGRMKTMDIEDCPIGTPAVREGLKKQHKWVRENITTFKKGATILLRQSTKRTPAPDGDVVVDMGDGKLERFFEEKLCITDPKAIITEYVGKYKFESPAGTFFQNNSSILSDFTAFVRANLHLPVPGSDSVSSAPKYLVDAYCGSGLFSVTCGEGFEGVIGVDVSGESVKYASENASANNVKNATFLVGQAEKLFEVRRMYLPLALD